MRISALARLLAVTAAFNSMAAMAALSPFGCDGGVTSVYTISLDPAIAAPVFANSAVCGTVSDARSVNDSQSINVGSFDTDVGVTIGAGAAVFNNGSTQSRVQGGAIYDFIPRLDDDASGFVEITYVARADLLDLTLSGQGKSNVVIRNQATVTISEIDDAGTITAVKDTQQLIIGQSPSFDVGEFSEFGSTLMLVSGRRYIITLNGLIDIDLTSNFDTDTGQFGSFFFSTAFGLSASILAAEGALLEYPGGVQTTAGDYPPFNTPALPLPGAIYLLILPLAAILRGRRCARVQ